HAVEQENVHHDLRGAIRPVSDRNRVKVAAYETPIEFRVVQDPNRHGEEGDPVASAPDLIPGEFAGHDSGSVTGNGPEHERRVAPLPVGVKHHHAHVEGSLDKLMVKVRGHPLGPVPTPVELNYFSLHATASSLSRRASAVSRPGRHLGS